MTWRVIVFLMRTHRNYIWAGLQYLQCRSRTRCREAASSAATLINYFTETCSSSEAGLYLWLKDFVYHSTLGSEVIQPKKRLLGHARMIQPLYGFGFGGTFRVYGSSVTDLVKPGGFDCHPVCFRRICRAESHDRFRRICRAESHESVAISRFCSTKSVFIGS
jgi:hypothetical protein